MSSCAPCGGVEVVPCFPFKTEPWKVRFSGFGFSTATLLLKTIVRCLYFEHLSWNCNLFRIGFASRLFSGSKYSFTWERYLVPPALGFWRAHPIGREEEVTDDTPDLALGRFLGRRVVNLATQSRRNWSDTDSWLVYFHVDHSWDGAVYVRVGGWGGGGGRVIGSGVPHPHRLLDMH